ncbi:alpha/beta fold hydrolase [Wenzhouxiangella sp. AB-CW3]|uniref:esterase/lipase family protein n=1 Tax=Wenzhouxiangella sp. AB-CW3 TaxID=2771012 RepID=UPI00168ACD83|nr:alpha/beta hydrolase [Wenzhouxiangella sp. AB-CW3]QOC23068.1 alpha/beta fold hydrolase [Wenzhouxiangella sp. AB-CW3]
MNRKVILVHGLWYGQLGLTLLRRRLVRAGFDCHGFSYPTMRRPLAANARSLYEFARRFDDGPVDFVGHSLGGLVILRMLDEFGGLPPGRVVLLGSPVRGSAVASEAADLPLIRPLVGRAKNALEYGYRAAPADRETGVVMGTGHVGVGRLFKSLETPSDGVVGVEECRLEGATDELVLPVTHTGLVTSRQGAEAVARFLESGRFGGDRA